MTRRRLYIAGGVALALVAAFLGGRFSRPVKVEERVKVETKIETRTEWRDRVIEKRVEGPTREVERIIEKPGAERVITRWIDRGPVTVDTSATAAGTSTASGAASSSASKVTDNARPGWAAGLAATWPSLSSRPERVGLELDRRILGTVWLGVRASAETDGSAPQVGAALRVEW